MRTLKYAILGLLNASNLTGYELMKQFELTLCEFWNAKHSQIYPELHKLLNEECIEYEVIISGTSLEKKLYHITPKGRNDFMKWMLSATELAPAPKDISRLKIFFSSYLNKEERISFLNDQYEQHKLYLEHLKSNIKKFDKIPSQTDPEFGDYLLLFGAIMREETTCSWLLKCQELSS